MSTGRRLVLVCNSHIDPVWLWPWEEGLAATLATFRAAAGFCDEFDGFAFCHNEALLYQWVEEFEPALFARIRSLVRAGRWHVIGGWYLQPDCNLPSGESFVRQVTVGLRYFREKFGVRPRVAFNVDPFGHTRGLVQVLKQAGYVGYLFCRPDAQHLPLASDDFVWVGYDGSTVLAHRAPGHYNSEHGRARAKVERWLDAHAHDEDGVLLWGVGNHGGGPSREDLRALAALAGDTADRAIVHGRPEDYFDRLADRAASLPRYEADLNPWAPGCYTSMSTVKRAHRRLEGRLYSTEKMLASAALQQLLPYPPRGTGAGSRRAALLRVPRHPARLVGGGGRGPGPASPRSRLRHRRSPSRPGVLRAARRPAARGRGRVPRLRPQPAPLPGRRDRGLRVPAAGAERGSRHAPGP